MSEIVETKTTALLDDRVSNPHHTGDLHNLRQSYRPNDQNYLKLSQMVRTYLKGKGKIRHLLRTRPKFDDPSFATLDEEDSMIMF